MEIQGRELREVERIMGHAKMEKAEHKPCVQSLHFVSGMDNDAFKLIEINKGIVDNLQEGDRITIRGDKAESAVLCTDNKTYDMKEQETSNLLLLIPELQMGGDLEAGENTFVTDREICSIHQKYFELREMKPKLKKLQELLLENPFSGMECEEDEDHQGTKYTFEDLLERVQASRKEIEEGLEKLEACQIQDHWRMLDFDFRGTVLDHILKLQEEEGWDLDHIPVKQCCDTLADLFPRNVVHHILLGFSDKHETENTDNDAEVTCKLSEDKVCLFFAEMILRPAGQFNFEEFQRVWQQSVPEGLKTGLYQLEGMALIDRDSKPAVIKYYPVLNLPEDIAERFQILFRTKEKWTADEIIPYIKDQETEKLKASALLTKYARASTQNGVKMYNSKRPLS